MNVCDGRQPGTNIGVWPVGGITVSVTFGGEKTCFWPQNVRLDINCKEIVPPKQQYS